MALLAIAACRRAPVQHVLQYSGHNVFVTNRAGQEIVVTAWNGAAPVRIARGATAPMPSTGGPSSWDLTITTSNGAVIYKGTVMAGPPQTITVDDSGARLTAPETEIGTRPAVKP